MKRLCHCKGVKYMNILVSGASGFMGSHLCPFLTGLGHDLTGLDSKNCDLTRPESLERFRGRPYDLIFHLAAWTRAGDFCMRHPAEQWVINQRLNTNMVDWWQKAQPQAKFVFIGTSSAYAPGSDLKEADYMAGVPHESLRGYGMSKRMLLEGAYAMSSQYGLKWLCAVSSALYGRGYHLDGRQMNFVFDLIRKIIRGREYGEKVILWGDGFQKREAMLVDDFINNLWRLTQNHENEIFNIGTGAQYSIRDFAAVICELVGYDPLAIEYDVSRYSGAASKCLNIDKILKNLPEYRLTPLKEGLARTIEWFYERRAFNIEIAG